MTPSVSETFALKITNRRPACAGAEVYISSDTSDIEGPLSGEEGLPDQQGDDLMSDGGEPVSEMHDLHTTTGVRNVFKEILGTISTVPGLLYEFGTALVEWRKLPRPEYISNAPSSVAGRQGSRLHAGRPL